VVAVALGIASVLLVRVAAGWLTNDARSAFAGAAIVAILPWSVRLGVSTVPELPTAACALLSLAALAPNAPPSRPIVGAFALLAATLSRSEPWFIAIGFAGFLAVDAFRDRKRLGANVAAISIVVAGPIVWSAWNLHTYGSATHYLESVTGYRQAMDQGA